MCASSSSVPFPEMLKEAAYDTGNNALRKRTLAPTGVEAPAGVQVQTSRDFGAFSC